MSECLRAEPKMPRRWCFRVGLMGEGVEPPPPPPPPTVEDSERWKEWPPGPGLCGDRGEGPGELEGERVLR